MLMLMLAKVNTFLSSHYQTQIKRSTVRPEQVEYDSSLLRQIQVFVAWFQKSNFGLIFAEG